jgi:hypothetical protein
VTTVRAPRKLRLAAPDAAELDWQREASMADEGGRSAAVLERQQAPRRPGPQGARTGRRARDDRWLLVLVAWSAGIVGLLIGLLGTRRPRA